MSENTSLKEKQKSKNKETKKANKARNLLLKICDKELKNKIKNEKTLINSISMNEFIKNFQQDFIITLKPKRFIYKKMNTTILSQKINIEKINIEEEKHIISIHKKLTIGYHNLNIISNEENELNSTNENSYINSEENIKKKKQICQQSFNYLQKLFKSLHSNFNNKKILSEDTLDELLKLNIEFFEKKKKSNNIY
jgi:hypothetical protein